jgi:DNA modification methylase
MMSKQLTIFNNNTEVHKTGLIFKDITFDEWQSIGEKLSQVESGIHWWIGDWLNYGEQRWGEMYTQAMDITEFDYQTLKKDKWVSDKIELVRRRTLLSWSHHCEVASLPPQDQDHLLQRAEDESLSVHKLRKEVRAYTRSLVDIIPIESDGTFVYHGDMLDILSICTQEYNLVIADPPYNVTEWDWDNIPEFLNITAEWIFAIKKVLKEKYHLFWFCSPKFAADIEIVFRNLGLPIKSRVVWHRRNMAMGSNAKDKFIDSWEMILHIGTRELNFPDEWGESRFDVQTFAVPQTNFEDTKYHPTQKPLELIRWLVDYGSFPGDRILDPFAGSGTTGAASDGRTCDLIEQDNNYVSIIERRLGIVRTAPTAQTGITR